ncbi:ribonuclease H-like domain-containing protein [Tanacetum coccineum]
MKLLAQSCPKLRILGLALEKNLEPKVDYESDFDDDGLCAVANACCQLESVSLSRRLHVGDVGVVSILRSSKNITSLDLGRCVKVTDESLKAIGEATRLRSLNLQGCYLITDLGLKYLATRDLKNSLMFLYFNECVKISDTGCCEAITGEALHAFADHPTLSYLALYLCHNISWEKVVSGSLVLSPIAEVVDLVLLGSSGGVLKLLEVLDCNLDAGNPLHVHNSNNSSSILVPFKLLGTQNYRMWNNAMKLALQARNKYGFVDGICLRDSYADSDVLYAQWDRCNAMVLTWIMNVVSSDVYIGLVYSKNAADVWKELNETYDKVDGSVVYNLLQKIRSVKQGGSTVADYYHRLNSLWREFDAITKLPKCVCPVKCSCAASTELALHQQLIKLMQFLMGLDDCYQLVRTALLTRDPLPGVKDAYATVSREESHRGIPETSEVIDTKMNATSFVAKSYNQNKKGCYELIGYPPGYKKGPNASKQNGFKPNFNANCDAKGSDKQPSACNSPTSFTADQMQKLLNLINDTTSGNTQANMAGANQHLTTSTIGMINVVDISSLNITVGHPNGTVATISHIGDLRLSNNVMLHDVLVVPGYCVSLLSVNKLIKDIKLFVGFDKDNCYIQDLDKGITLGTSSESGGLYLFDDTKNKSLGNVNIVMAFNVSKDLWHSRLGHPADQVLNVLKNDLNLPKNTSVSACETCHRVKQTREPFPLSDHKSVKPGELVHLDLWGPYKVSSREGFKYFLTIVDDYSRAVWTYLLKTKDEVFDCLSLEEDSATHIGYNILSKGNVQDENPDLNDIAPSGDHNLEEGQPRVRRSSRPTKMPAKLNDFMLDSKLKYGIEKHVNYSKLNTVNYCFATTLNKSVEPTTYYDAVKDVRWIEAMNNEIEALIRNNTWTLTDLPIGRKSIDNKWLYKIKYKASGQVDKFKARVVAKRFSQREGIDFDETFSPMVKMVTIRCLICIVVSNDWPLFQLDVNNGFLYDDLNEDIYMSLPLGFECSDKTKVCKLNKALYGLKQAPRQWNAKLTTVLAEHGYVQSKFDYSLYIKHSDDVFVALLVYVDDFIITGNSLDEIEKFKLFLKSKFMIKDLGVMKYFLGIEVLGNSNGICITQRKYCLELIHEFGLLAAKPVTTPLPENYVLAVDESESDKFLKNIFEYQKLLGKLIYLTHTRPDISYVVHCLSQHMHAPLQSHLKVALRVIRYLKNSPDQTADLFTKGHGTAQHLKLCNQLSLVLWCYLLCLEGPFLALSGSCLKWALIYAVVGFSLLGFITVSIRWKLVVFNPLIS